MSRFNPEESAAILNEADWEALTDLLDGKADTNSDGWKNLVDLGFISDEESLTDGAERLFAGLFQGDDLRMRAAGRLCEPAAHHVTGGILDHRAHRRVRTG